MRAVVIASTSFDQVIATMACSVSSRLFVAEDLDFVAVPEPVVAQEAELAVERVRARHDDAAVAPHVEVLEGVQAEARGHAEGAHEAVPIVAPMAWQASSTTGSPCPFATSRIEAILAGCPA